MDLQTSGPFATAEFASLVPSDAGCNVVASATLNGSLGTVTVSSLTPDAVSGTFDITFQMSSGVPRDRITGHFSAHACARDNPPSNPMLCQAFATQ